MSEFVNYNNENIDFAAISAIKVEDEIIAAEATTDQVALSAGDNVELIPDTTNKEIVIKAKLPTSHPASMIVQDSTHRFVTDSEKAAWNAAAADNVVVDTALSTSSTNPVQNKVITAAINSKANASDLTSHTGNKSNPHGVTLSQLGVTATSTELNYVDGVTSNIQTQLNNKASTSSLTSHTGNTTSHITSSERSTWNAKASTAVATTSSNGLMSSSDKSKLNGITAGATTYTLEVDAFQVNTINLELKNAAGASSTIPFSAGNGIILSSTSNGSQIHISATSNRIFNTICSTAAGTAAKVVQIDDFGSSYCAGDLINVFFKYENTSAAPTLNINNIGARSIRYRGSTSIPKNLIKDNVIYSLLYNIEESSSTSTSYWDVIGIYPHTGVDIASNDFAPLSMQQLDSSNPGVGIGFKKNPSTYYGYIGMNKENGRLNRHLSSNTNTYYTVHDTTTVQCGTLTITPSTANANTTVKVTFPNAFSSIPRVIVTPVTGSPGTVSTAIASNSVTTTGCSIVLNRPETTSTTIYWIACGY